jgi:hypothetical protein
VQLKRFQGGESGVALGINPNGAWLGLLSQILIAFGSSATETKGAHLVDHSFAEVRRGSIIVQNVCKYSVDSGQREPR